MSDLNLDVSSPMTQEDRDLGKPPPVDQIDYLPWGTRSLKLRLSGDYKGLVNVRPEPTSDDADYITGSILRVDGGYVVARSTVD